MVQETTINKLERGRAEFAYKCVKDTIMLNSDNDNIKKVLDDFVHNIKSNIERISNNDQKQKLLKRLEEIYKKPDTYLKKENYDRLAQDEKEKIIGSYIKLLQNYRSYSRKIPTMILTNGLGQTLAFVKAKSDKETAYKLLYVQITEYIRSDQTVRIKMPQEKSDLVEWAVSCSTTEYRYITQEMLVFLNWLRRFAEGMIEEGGR
ncbi:MAG: type III-B CRISPR module-associated protein Cmr5 [Tepidanaerobacteraceae bacterium]|jgi:CRISPR-associated protein Cmr5|nr:type III-B CRISPR module-associated protein Cmr5 [Tepidanaerobacteraceae bacterium]